jgi:hypothetical protein
MKAVIDPLSSEPKLGATPELFWTLTELVPFAGPEHLPPSLA